MQNNTIQIPRPREAGKRFVWLTNMIRKRKFKIGAEIGCAGGRTTNWLLKNTDVFLYAVDLWENPPADVSWGIQYRAWEFPRVRNRFVKNTRGYRGRVKELRGISWEMAKHVEDNSLDFIFIDADHEYESVVRDILAWTPKVKPGGMVSGHDTHFPGVLKAINELIPHWKTDHVDHVWYCSKEDVKC